MAVKNLSKFITPNLEIEVGDKTYSVAPPSREDGKIMMAINVVGLSAIYNAEATVEGRELEDVDPEYKAIAKANRDRDLGELSLGDTYQQILDDGWDGPTIDTLASYAFYYWTLGEAAADQIMESKASGGTAPKGRTPSKSGQPTG